MASSCPICMNDIDTTFCDNIAYFPCVHCFHNSCLMNYMKNKVDENNDISCPICRQVHYRVESQDYMFIKMMISNASKGKSVKSHINPQYNTNASTIHVHNHVVDMSRADSPHVHVANQYRRYIILLMIVVIVCVSTVIMVKIFK